MTGGTFTFRIDDDLKAAFADAAKAQDRTAAQLLRVLMREAVERQREARAHDAWYRREIEQALREADDPAVRRTPDDEVRSRWRRQRAELAKRAGDDAA